MVELFTWGQQGEIIIFNKEKNILNFYANHLPNYFIIIVPQTYLHKFVVKSQYYPHIFFVLVFFFLGSF